jgi:hypothetical protein
MMRLPTMKAPDRSMDDRERSTNNHYLTLCVHRMGASWDLECNFILSNAYSPVGLSTNVYPPGQYLFPSWLYI